MTARPGHRSTVTRFPPGGRPVLVWDGDCGFCASSVEWLRRRVGPAIEYVPYQAVEGLFPDVEEEFPQAVRLIEPDGLVRSGAEAIFRALDYGGRSRLWLTFVDSPVFARISESVYRWVARHRPLLGRAV